MNGEVLPVMDADGDDYVAVFQRLSALEREIKANGLTPGRLAARANLELAAGNFEEALNSARELRAMAEGEAALVEANRIILMVTRKLKKGARDAERAD